MLLFFSGLVGHPPAGKVASLTTWDDGSFRHRNSPCASRSTPDSPIEIGIRDGRIAAIGERLGARATTEIDARDNLVTESFVNPHLHLCKVWTLSMMQDDALEAYQGEPMAKAMTAIELASKIKEKY